jgi:septal ring factor EnvC (AmiA/AmiB activator)
VTPGEIVASGAPVGFLGGREMGTQDFLMLPAQGNDVLGAETLYMELWRAGEPVDPGPWLGVRADAQDG